MRISQIQSPLLTKVDRTAEERFTLDATTLALAALSSSPKKWQTVRYFELARTIRKLDEPIRNAAIACDETDDLSCFLCSAATAIAAQYSDISAPGIDPASPDLVTWIEAGRHLENLRLEALASLGVPITSFVPQEDLLSRLKRRMKLRPTA